MGSRHKGFESDLAQGWGTSQSVCKGMLEQLMTSYAPLGSGWTHFIMHDLVSTATVLTVGSFAWAEGAMMQGCRELEIRQLEGRVEGDDAEPSSAKVGS